MASNTVDNLDCKNDVWKSFKVPELLTLRN